MGYLDRKGTKVKCKSLKRNKTSFHTTKPVLYAFHPCAIIRCAKLSLDQSRRCHFHATLE
jgi:hypothetical protein